MALTAKRTASQGQPPHSGNAGGCNLLMVVSSCADFGYATRLAAPSPGQDRVEAVDHEIDLLRA